MIFYGLCLNVKSTEVFRTNEGNVKFYVIKCLSVPEINASKVFYVSGNGDRTHDVRAISAAPHLHILQFRGSEKVAEKAAVTLTIAVTVTV